MEEVLSFLLKRSELQMSPHWILPLFGADNKMDITGLLGCGRLDPGKTQMAYCTFQCPTFSSPIW